MRKQTSPGTCDLDQLLHALNHPVRRAILRCLVAGPGSAKTLKEQMGQPLGTVSYHLNQVLADRCNAVELVETIRRRGSIEKVYRLRPEARLIAELTMPSAGQTTSTPVPEQISLEAFIAVAATAIENQAFNDLSGSAWEWFPAAVDTDTWTQICEARADFNTRVREVLGAFHSAPGEQPTRSVIVGVATFPLSTEGEP